MCSSSSRNGARAHIVPVALLCLWLVSGLAHPGELTFTLSPSGCITAWQRSAPVPFAQREDFGKLACPEDKWELLVSPTRYLDLSSLCRDGAETAFFLRTSLDVPAAGVYTLCVFYRGCVVLNLDGEKLCEGESKRSYTLLEAEGQRRLDPGRHEVELRIGSYLKQCLFYLKVTPPGNEMPRVVLKTDEREKALAAAFSLVPTSPFVDLEKERPAVELGFRAGVPILPGKVRAFFRVIAGGKDVLSVRLPELGLDSYLQPLAVSFDCAERTPYFEVKAFLNHDSAEIGSLSARIFSKQGLTLWKQDLESKVQDKSLLPLLRLKLEKIALIEPYYSDYPSYFSEKLIAEVQDIEQLLAGKLPGTSGLLERAYTSPQDGSPQPYLVYVPRSYGDKPVPCFVYLHGYAPDLNKADWGQIPDALMEIAEKEGGLIVAPFARSNTDFQAIGETDVLYVLDLVKKDYKIQPNRVFLVGYSMGGMGAFTLAVHYPHLWAGLIALSSRWDYYDWKALDKRRVEPFKTFLLDMEFGEPLKENLLHIPVLLYHGEDDTLADPAQMKVAAQKLKDIGYSVELRTTQGFGHWIADYALSNLPPTEWLKGKTRPLKPSKIVFKTYSIRYNRAYWLRIEDFEKWGTPAEVALELKDRTISIVSSNVAALSLSPPKELQQGGKVKVVWNKTVQELDPAAEINLGKIRTGLRKTPSLCGPVKDAFNNPFLLVYGAASRDSENMARRWAKEWDAFAKGYPRLRSDDKLSDKEIASNNLLLFGTPATNKFLARVADKLPIRITEDTFAIGEHTFPSKGNGLIFCYPNPLNPARYLVVHAGLFYGDALSDNHKYDLLPDFIVYNADRDYDSTNCYLCAGFFDMGWKLDPALLWLSDGKPRPKPGVPNMWMR